MMIEWSEVHVRMHICQPPLRCQNESTPQYKFYANINVIVFFTTRRGNIGGRSFFQEYFECTKTGGKVNAAPNRMFRLDH